MNRADALEAAAAFVTAKDRLYAAALAFAEQGGDG